MGWSSTVYVKDSARWCLGKSVQSENTWVCATQNGIGIVRHGDSSEDIDAQLSEIEDNGDEEFWSECQKQTQEFDVDSVPTNTRSSQGKSQLYIFEDNEVAIKMIIEGRSPTMRHVSRTHRVALDCLFVRINQISWHQEPARWHSNKGRFSRNKWNHLLCLFNFMNFSTYSGNHLTSFLS